MTRVEIIKANNLITEEINTEKELKKQVGGDFVAEKVRKKRSENSSCREICKYVELFDAYIFASLLEFSFIQNLF